MVHESPSVVRATIECLLALAALLIASAPAHADFSGTVVRILDGDTLEVLVDKSTARVRLAEIDAPEKGQAFGAKARQALGDLTFRRIVTVQEAGKDRYGRTIGTVLVDGQSANRAMVATGVAWAYRAYLVDRSLLRLEQDARTARRGLWIDSSPIPPWEWRAEKRTTGNE